MNVESLPLTAYQERYREFLQQLLAACDCESKPGSLTERLESGFVALCNDTDGAYDTAIAEKFQQIIAEADKGSFNDRMALNTICSTLMQVNIFFGGRKVRLTVSHEKKYTTDQIQGLLKERRDKWLH